METLIVHPKNQKQLATIEAILKALDVSFNKEEKSPYNPEFVTKIRESEEDVKAGRTRKITLDEIWK
jgi:hypothetical protein